jgi:hypothetical protein
VKTSELRSLFLIFGAVFSLVGDLLFSWFTIDYHPAGSLYTYHVEYDISAQVQFLGSGVSIDQLKSYYISLGSALLLAFVYSIETAWLRKILENWITNTSSTLRTLARSSTPST